MPIITLIPVPEEFITRFTKEEIEARFGMDEDAKAIRVQEYYRNNPLGFQPFEPGEVKTDEGNMEPMKMDNGSELVPFKSNAAPMKSLLAEEIRELWKENVLAAIKKIAERKVTRTGLVELMYGEAAPESDGTFIAKKVFITKEEAEAKFGHEVVEIYARMAESIKQSNLNDVDMTFMGAVPMPIEADEPTIVEK